MAMKWVAQMPHPVAMPAATIQIARVRPPVSRARWNRLTATRRPGADDSGNDDEAPVMLGREAGQDAIHVCCIRMD